MDYKNGYKVAYEVAKNNERAIYASTTNRYPNRDAEGKITDDKLAKFVDADLKGKTIYEDKNGDFFVADTNAAKFDKEGKVTGVPLASLNRKEKATETTTVTEPVDDENTDPDADPDLESGNDGE